MNIYNEEGWLDVPKIMGMGMPFVFCTGARGTGKTYGALEYGLDGGPFIYMRRTQGEVDILCSNEMLNPFLPLNRNTGRNIGFKKVSKYTAAIYERQEEEDGTLSIVGPPLGMCCALSTFANLRGFNGSQFDFLIYDEFIPESHVRPLRDEHLAFMNAYETINRNRELEGRSALRCFCASNSNRLDNALYMGLGLVSKVDRMKRDGQILSVLGKRGIILLNMEQSPISERKRNTALYRMAAGTGFEKMALDNVYVGEDARINIGSKPLREYNAICAVGELCIYRHKSRSEYYVSEHTSGTPPTFATTAAELERFRRSFSWLWSAYLERKVFFESRICEILLTKYFD